MSWSGQPPAVRLRGRDGDSDKSGDVIWVYLAGRRTSVQTSYPRWRYSSRNNAPCARQRLTVPNFEVSQASHGTQMAALRPTMLLIRALRLFFVALSSTSPPYRACAP